jgi:hypothetical protein
MNSFRLSIFSISPAGLPDGIFGSILEGLAMEDVFLQTFGLFYAHLVYFIDICYSLLTFVIVY